MYKEAGRRGRRLCFYGCFLVIEDDDTGAGDADDEDGNRMRSAPVSRLPTAPSPSVSNAPPEPDGEGL